MSFFFLYCLHYPFISSFTREYLDNISQYPFIITIIIIVITAIIITYIFYTISPYRYFAISSYRSITSMLTTHPMFTSLIGPPYLRLCTRKQTHPLVISLSRSLFWTLSGRKLQLVSYLSDLENNFDNLFLNRIHIWLFLFRA